jgi:hypothetical protein
LLISSIFVGVMDSIGSLSHLSITPALISHTLIGTGLFFFPMLAVFSALRPFIERDRARKYARLPPLDLTLPPRNPDP